ncbi:MAG: hypothetical protein KBA31_20255 [Alphaproteobacteria bacterium]|nr:hypothetical protein [Alphaproteobacteria bacterium]
MYNLTVEGLHTYAVGRLETLVHNACKTGVIYKAPGSQTPSGNPYIGRTEQGTGPVADPKARGSRDGRDRGGNTEVIDTYDPKNPGEGAYKEQRALDDAGGVSKTDNKRNEVSDERMKRLEQCYGKPKCP